MKILQKKSGVKGIVTAISIAAVIIAVVLCVAYLYAQSTVENNAELADMYAMSNAELAAELLMQDGEQQAAGGYWFDPVTNTLIPDDEDKPANTGLGTAKRGHGKSAYETKTGYTYPYDEGTDYRDKVIHLIIGDEMMIEWVPKD